MPTEEIERAYEVMIKSISLNPEDLVAFKVPPVIQSRISDLLALSKSEKLSFDEERELDRYLALDSEMRVLKTKALIATTG